MRLDCLKAHSRLAAAHYPVGDLREIAKINWSGLNAAATFFCRLSKQLNRTVLEALKRAALPLLLGTFQNRTGNPHVGATCLHFPDLFQADDMHDKAESALGTLAAMHELLPSAASHGSCLEGHWQMRPSAIVPIRGCSQAGSDKILSCAWKPADVLLKRKQPCSARLKDR